MGIDCINVKENSSCKPYFTTIINNKSLASASKKNIYILAFLNKCIYKTPDTTSIISSNDENEYNFDINIENINHKFNNIQNRIWISNGHIKNINLKNISSNKFFSIVEMMDFINSSKIFDDTLILGNIINDSIQEYEAILNCYLSTSENDIKKEIQFYKTEYANTTFNCLDILNKLVKYCNLSNASLPFFSLSKNFNCDKWIKNHDICKLCCGYLRVCGFNCSGENEERRIGDDTYVLHLKPYSYLKEGNEKHLIDLTLRIYFKWDNFKIKIGYIGKHF